MFIIIIYYLKDWNNIQIFLTFKAKLYDLIGSSNSLLKKIPFSIRRNYSTIYSKSKELSIEKSSTSIISKFCKF